MKKLDNEIKYVQLKDTNICHISTIFLYNFVSLIVVVKKIWEEHISNIINHFLPKLFNHY